MPYRLAFALMGLLAVSSGPPSMAQERGGVATPWVERDRAPRAQAAHAVTGAEVPCVEGEAAGYPCQGVNLLAFVPLAELGGGGPRVSANDLWGWTDPATGAEYALLGRSDGTAFVNLSDPQNPVFLGFLPTHTEPSTWRDVKVYADHAFIVSEATGHGMQVFDLTQLRGLGGEVPVTFSETAYYGSFGRAHNLAVDTETGFAYAVGLSGRQNAPEPNQCGPGLHMIDIREPADPQFAGCFNSSVGRGYTHDAQCVRYRGPDEEHQGREICIGADEEGIAITDVTDKSAPTQLGTGTYPQTGYVHQGWLTEDHRYFFQDDELDEANGLTQNTRTLIWDFSDLDAPVLAADYFGPTPAIDHNQYVRGDTLYQANYQSGLRLLDIADPLNPVEIAYFDTYPQADRARFDGAWSVYPFFESGVLIVSGIGEGLFVVRPGEVPANRPVGLRAEVLGADVVLTWQTISEAGNAGFAVQQATGEAAEFETLAFVETQGDAEAAQRYTYRIEGLPPGRYRFRLRQQDAGADGFAFEAQARAQITLDGPYLLARPYPNPFRAAATLELTLRSAQAVEVAVYDVLGRRVALLHSGPLAESRRHAFTLDGSGLPSGLYLWRIEGEEFSETATALRVR